MRVIDMLNSSRQMMFENAVEGYEYTGRGTCFLCRYNGCDFAITAKHVIKGFTADDVRIQFHLGAHEFAPHNAQVTIKISDVDDPDWGDLAFYPLERIMYDDTQFGGQLPYPLQHPQLVWQPLMPGSFIMRGFPHDLNAIDYEQAVINQQAAIIEADYLGASPMAHCHEVAFRDLAACTTLDGLSGTPVFWVGDSKPRDHRFAGIMLRATYASKRGHFVHARVILAALGKILGS
ncbi:hypothetical protein V6B08_15410 [Ferrovibrio sp. MS7]|uniref:hypothetical protein n=1 Tax=Ferrovibrio plantarum TaxID=3119164 RepID=UPI0031350F38